MKQLFLLFLIFGTWLTSAQDRIRYRDIVWPIDSHDVFVPQKWAEEPAVILERVIRYQKYRARSRFSGKEYEIYYKIKFQKPRGVEQFRYFFIPYMPQTSLDRLDARLTKPDGRVADFDARFFKNKRIREPVSGFSPDQFLIFEVPTVETGDQLELFCRYQGHPLPRHVYFDDYLPIVRSTYVLTHPGYYPFLYTSHHGAPEAWHKEKFYRQHYKWQMEQVPPRRQEGFFCPALYLPHVEQVFAPTFQDEYGWPLDWWIYLRQLNRLQTEVNQRYDKTLEKFLQNLWQTIPPQEVKARIKAVHDYINEHLTLTRYPRGINIGNDLNHGRICPDVLNLFYDDLLRRFDIPYRLVLARERSRGPLDTGLVSLDQISHTFYEFTDTLTGERHYLIPQQWEGSYALDELPGDLLGTQAVFIEAPNETVTFELLPEYPVEESKIHRFAIVHLSDYESEVSYPVREQWTGAASAYWSELRQKDVNPQRPQWRRYLHWRKKWPDLGKRPDLISFDAANPGYSTEWQYRIEKIPVDWSGDTVSLVPQQFIQAHQVYKGPVQRTYPLHLPYGGSDQSDIYLHFPGDMIPLTFPEGSWRLAGLMEARFSTDQVDSQTYRLHFLCTYFKDTYSAGEAMQMRTLWQEIIRVLNVPFRMTKK